MTTPLHTYTNDSLTGESFSEGIKMKGIGSVMMKVTTKDFIGICDIFVQTSDDEKTWYDISRLPQITKEITRKSAIFTHFVATENPITALKSGVIGQTLRLRYVANTTVNKGITTEIYQTNE